MKSTALIAAAALAFGTAALANQQDTDKAARGEEATHAEHQDHGTAGQKMRGAMHKLGEKTRHALHRAGDSMHRVARRDHANDTHAMGGPGSAEPSRDAAAARQARMDDAYADWQARHPASR